MKKQLCYLLARHGFSLKLDEGPTEVSRHPAFPDKGRDVILLTLPFMMVVVWGTDGAIGTGVWHLHLLAQLPSLAWQVEDEDLREQLRAIISNSKLSEHFLALARDLDVMEAKTPDDVYKVGSRDEDLEDQLRMGASPGPFHVPLP